MNLKHISNSIIKDSKHNKRKDHMLIVHPNQENLGTVNMKTYKNMLKL